MPADNEERVFRLKGPTVYFYSQIFQFAIFYNGLLEFTYSDPLVIYGRVHANGAIYVGSPASLTFNNTVTTAGAILKTNWAGHHLSEYTGAIIYKGSPPNSYNTPYYLVPLGTNNTPAAAHAIIDLPPISEPPSSDAGATRFYNRAKLVLLVSNSTTTVKIRNAWGLIPAADPLPVVLTASNESPVLSAIFPFLSLTNVFTDQREQKTVIPSQIDMGKFAAWAKTNVDVINKLPPESGAWPNVLYVADYRTATTTQLPAVRIVNGTTPPVNGGTGLTVVTPNPLYVWGNYNCTNAAYLGTTNTSATVPCALISDALTILSPTWDDALSAGNYESRTAVSTTVNAGILAGAVYSTGSGVGQYSGGVQNLPRLLEDWSGETLFLNGSIVNSYYSTWATNQYQAPGVYYGEPSRQISFDPNFNDPKKQPAGTWTISLSLPP